MNKILKLPLFLGVAGSACALILGGVYSITNPIIKKNEKEKAAQKYKEIFASYDIGGENISDDIAVSNIAGCSSKVTVIKGNSLKGMSYTCTAKGFAGDIKFLISFANGEYLAYTNMGHTESKYEALDILNNYFTAHKDASTTLDVAGGDYKTFIAGNTVSCGAVGKIIENCRADYMTWYAAQLG